MKFYSLLPLLLTTFLILPCSSFSQIKEETIVIQKPASELSLNPNPRAIGINFKLNGDKSRLVILSDNELEIWDTNSRRILLKKKLYIEKAIAGYEINYTGNIYALLKHTNENEKQYSIELFKNQKEKPFVLITSKTNNLIDPFTKIRFNKQGDKFAIVHRKYGVQIYQINNNETSLLKHIPLEKSYFIKIIDFEFSNDDRHFFILKGNDMKHNEPIIYQKWNLNSFIMEQETTSSDFGLNTWMISQMQSNQGFKSAVSSWNLEYGLVTNCKYIQTLSRSKRVGNINPNHKSYVELYSVNQDKTQNLLSHNAALNEAIVIDSQTVLTSDENRNIQIWNINTGKCINTLETDKVNTNEDLDIPLLKPLTRLAIIQVDPTKKEVYYSISQHRTIRVWNYEYNTNEIFQSDLAKVSSPFFTSDSTVIYKKDKHLEHFNFKNQSVVEIKKENSNNKYFDFKFSKTSNKGITKTNNSLKLWSAAPLIVLDSIETQESPFGNYHTSNDLNYIAFVELEAATNALSSLKKGKVDSDKLFQDLMKHVVNKTYKFNGTPDKQTIKIKLFNTTHNRLNFTDEISIPSFAIGKVSFNTSKKELLISAFNVPVVGKTDNYEVHTNYIYNLEFKTLTTLPKIINGVSEIIPTTNKIFSFKKEGESIEVKILNTESYKVEKHFILSYKNISKFNLINKNEAILSGKEDNITLNLDSGKTKLLSNNFNHIDTLKDLFVTSSNANLSFYKNSLDNKIYDKYFHKDNLSSIIICSNNYYLNKGRGYELLSLFKNNKIYGFEQFDLKYHRPDLVIESIKETLNNNIYENKALYQLAYEKRLERLNKKEEGLESTFHVPELTITNKAELPNKTDKTIINLDINASDQIYKLEKLQLSVNGINIRNLTHNIKNQKQFSTSIPLVLSNGKNKILASVINEKGSSSFIEEVNIEYVGEKKASNLFIVSLGVSKYQNLVDTPNSAKDAKILGETFKKTHTNSVNYLSLIDNQVTKDNLTQIASFLSKTKENDVVLFFTSGHALLENNEYFFCTNNSSLNNIKTTGISYSDFDKLLGNTKSRNRLLILNTCYSGEIFNVNTIKEMKAINLMREVFEDLKLTNGTTIISASEGTNKYYESNTEDHGKITLAILNLLKTKKEITVKEFCNEIIKFCSIKNKNDPFQSSNNKNIPLVRHNNIYNNFKIW